MQETQEGINVSYSEFQVQATFYQTILLTNNKHFSSLFS